MEFDVIGILMNVETFAARRGIRSLARLNKRYGAALWRKRKGYAHIRLPDGTERLVELHWYEASGIGRKEMKIKQLLEDMSTSTFAVCIRNIGYEASLELRKLYEVLQDNQALEQGLLRVIDESGENYLFPQEWFVMLALPKAVAAHIAAAA